MDAAHNHTDEVLEQMEKRIASIYSRAEKEIGQKWKAYLEESGKEIDALQKAYDKAKDGGERDETRRAGRELAQAKRQRTISDKRFKELTEQTALQITRANETALAYVNGQLPSVYSVNYNALGEIIDKADTGYSFTLTNAETVKNLATSNKSLLPYKELDKATDVAWNVKKINSEVLQGIIQGESMDKIAKRLSSVENMNANQAIRTARTAVTGAENKGRQDSYQQAEDDGIVMGKEWISTNDGRTRHTHRNKPDGVGGEIVGQDETFSNGLLFPGDPAGDPAEVYNCRCTMAGVVLGFRKK